MEFLPWKTINLDGSFRVTAPESVSEEILEEVSDGVTFRFNSDLEEVKLEILLNAPWGWKECFPLSEQENPPAKFICRLISRSTGRRTLVELEDGGMDCWFTETSYKSLREGEELRVEALLVRATDLKKTSEEKNLPQKQVGKTSGQKQCPEKKHRFQTSGQLFR